MARSRSAVTSIPAGASFVDALACGLLDRWPADPLGFSAATILLPTRRACRSLREAFMRASDGKPLLLPHMLPLGDLDAEELLLGAEDIGLGDGAAAELPPAMPALRRQLLLTRLILQWSRTESVEGAARGLRPSEDQAARLAEELARLIDQVDTEGLGFEGLAELVPADYAEHWQLTLDFLKIVTEHWPAIQAEQGCIGPAERRRRLLEAQAEAWRRVPPATPVVVAGSTGSIPATAELMAVVMGLPEGLVVLPGLDREADEATWRAIRADPNHPQHGLALLLQRLGIERDAVDDWPGVSVSGTATARGRFLSRALAPAAGSPHGEREEADLDALRKALTEVQRIDCGAPGEEATVIALLLRQALEVAGRTAALVTPDRGLARRVAAELQRWDIEIDDSAGTPLAETPAGVFLRLTAEMVAAELAPLPLLAALKHPLAAGGLAEGAFRARVRALELAVLRGPRPAPGFAGLRRALAAVEAGAELLPWLEALERMAAPFIDALQDPRAGLAETVAAHAGFAEALAANDALSGAERLWAQDAGEAAAAFVAELGEAARSGPRLAGERYPALLDSLMSARVVRPKYGLHPRLAILGPLEARLQHLDVMVLGGLNEATWPAETDPGPWLSRPMRADFGLPPPERRIGLAAHDFTQAFAAPRIFLTRSARVEGTPTVPSRWLLRIDGLLKTLGPDLGLRGEEGQWLSWAAALDRPIRQIAVPQPAPCPPVAARPRSLSVTQIETWMRDPYALYARQILGLRALDPLDADPGVAERGILVHTALERFVRHHPDALPADPAAALLAVGREVFAALHAKPGLWAFWWPRFERIADWFVALEGVRRGRLRRAGAEVRGALQLQGPAGPFELRAKADRVDLLSDGGISILDYKTGALPGAGEIELGFAPQLPLEAAIAVAGGFAEVPASAPTELAFWRLSGGEPAGEVKAVKGDPAELAAAARDGLERLVAAFDDAATAYRATPRPEWAPRYNDYAHLARIAEWSSLAGGEEAS